MSELSKITIHDEILAGFNIYKNANYMLIARIVPVGTTKAFTKKMDNVYEYASNSKMETITLTNKPLFGFKIGRPTIHRRSYSESYTTVRVEDPRGFEINISAENALMLLTNNVVDNHEIMHECIWGFEGNMPVLLPINGEEYAHYLETKNRIDNSVNGRSVKAGDTVTVLGGDTGTYLGKMVVITTDYDYSRTSTSFIAKKSLVHTVRVDKPKCAEYQTFSTFKAEKVLSVADAKMTDSEIIETMACDRVENRLVSSYGHKMLVPKGSKLSLHLEPMDIDAFAAQYNMNSHHNNRQVFGRSGSKLMHFDTYATFKEYKKAKSYSINNMRYSWREVKTELHVGRNVTIDDMSLVVTPELSEFDYNEPDCEYFYLVIRATAPCGAVMEVYH